jgi:hypothetical protein
VRRRSEIYIAVKAESLLAKKTSIIVRNRLPMHIGNLANKPWPCRRLLLQYMML